MTLKRWSETVDRSTPATRHFIGFGYNNIVVCIHTYTPPSYKWHKGFKIFGIIPGIVISDYIIVIGRIKCDQNKHLPSLGIGIPYPKTKTLCIHIIYIIYVQCECVFVCVCVFFAYTYVFIMVLFGWHQTMCIDDCSCHVRIIWRQPRAVFCVCPFIFSVWVSWFYLFFSILALALHNMDNYTNATLRLTPRFNCQF